MTPFLLSRINDVTKGRSLSANIALVKNNARVGAEVARLLAGGVCGGEGDSHSSMATTTTTTTSHRPKVRNGED